MTVTRLILIRHGQPTDGHGRCYGRLDVPLSPEGRAQILRARQFLLSADVAAVYTSSLRRAIESASLLWSGDRTPITADARICELDFGSAEGVPYGELEARDPQLFAEWMRRPTEVTFPGGETVGAMAVRVREAYAEIRQRHHGASAAIVSHGGVNRIILADALGLPLPSMFRLAQDYACFNLVEYVDDRVLVRAMNIHPGALC